MEHEGYGTSCFERAKEDLWSPHAVTDPGSGLAFDHLAAPAHLLGPFVWQACSHTTPNGRKQVPALGNLRRAGVTTLRRPAVQHAKSMDLVCCLRTMRCAG